jgi:uncharacterized protein (DUF2236 family)
MCGVDSATWRLRQRGGIVLSMAKARAALLQIAHPKIAAGLVDHSSFDADPFARVRLTGQTMSAIVFGSAAERTEALRLLRQLHAGVRGTVAADGDTYRALDPDLLWFVLATLIDSDLLVERTYIRAFDERERDAYYEEATALADAFRIPPSLVPMDRAGLRDYIASACAELTVGTDARRLGWRILDPSFVRVPRPVRWGYRQVMTDLLPAPVRRGYGCGEDARLVPRLVVSGVRVVLPRVPPRLRRVRLRPAA